MSDFEKFLYECFTVSGRMSRKRYAKLMYLAWFPLISMWILEWLIVDAWELGARLPHVVTAIQVIKYSGALFLFFAEPFWITRRLHDVGKSGWSSWFPNLTLFVPIPGFCFLGTVFIWWLMFKDGDAGKNKYGEPPPDD